MDLHKMTDLEIVEQWYADGYEDTRLNRSQSKRVEFLTNARFIEKYLRPGDKILDVGAGAGEYSLYFARKGHRVCAVEPAEGNLRVFRKKLRPEDSVELSKGNALDLSLYENGTFDVVLLFGPLYHLREERDRLQCIREAKRVCKSDGFIFFAFISNDMVFLTEFCKDERFFTEGEYNKETFQLHDLPFVFHTVDACRELLAKGGIHILEEAASDGASELLGAHIDSLDEANYRQYLQYHFYICQKPELLGMSNHLLFIGEQAHGHEI